MKNRKTSRLFAALLLTLWSLPNIGLGQQSDPNCFAEPGQNLLVKSAFFTYGSGNRMKTSTRRMKATIGQTFVQSALDDRNNMNWGFWSSLLVAPQPPFIKATQGELLDRIQLTWSNNPLGAQPVNGYNIYRDGIFLVNVGKNVRSYNDFNVIAGRNYFYEVRGVNIFGEGSSGKALGFQVPNGVVTGWVRTVAGNPVADALVTLEPMQGYSAFFSQLTEGFAEADTSTGGHFLPTSDAVDWTLAFWSKANIGAGPSRGGAAAGLLNIFKIEAANLLADANPTGMEITIGSTVLTGNFPAGIVTDWHHTAITFSGGQYRLFLDGQLVDLKAGPAVSTSPRLDFGGITAPDEQIWLDELRVYHTRLDELDLANAMTGTASSLTPGLKYYWNMDEGAGTKTFDLLHRNRIFFCGGASFSADRPPVRVSGLTNDQGYYRIESANYGTGTTFLATPSKNFYKKRALKFIQSESDYATLPDFQMPKKATLELWVNNTSTLGGNQTLLTKYWGASGDENFTLGLVSGTLVVQIKGSVHPMGTLGFGYHHLALTIDSLPNSTLVELYKDGVLAGTFAFPSLAGDWTSAGTTWTVGAYRTFAAPTPSAFFDGLIDEIAVYDSLLLPDKILEHAQNARDPQEKNLSVYFPFDEGSATVLYNSGMQLIDGAGQTFGTEWTVLTPHQSTTPHVFAPATRQVSLNPSITSVDQVDFVDRSTVAVTGFVRYANTSCFAENIEILVDGESYKPKVLTDSTGRFAVELEPGQSVTLTPVFKDHEFYPPSKLVYNVFTPVAGLVFNDITVREIAGTVAGGDCHASIITNPGQPGGTQCAVRVRSLDGCFEKLTYLDNPEGEFVFDNIPPIEVTVAVAVHSNPDIKAAFQLQGGKQLDMSEKEDTVVNFIYYAPPQVELVAGLDTFNPPFCNTIVLEQYNLETIQLKVKEQYDTEVCYLDTAQLQIINGLANEVVNTTLSNGTRSYTFRVAGPNGTPPFLKTLQVVATNLAGNESSLVRQVLVTGTQNKHNTFTTQLPHVPSLVLHDPPGDQSYSFFEKNQTICQSVKMVLDFETGVGGGIDLDFGAEEYIVAAPLGAGNIFHIATEGNDGITAQVTYQKINDNTFQTCTSFSERIVTNDDELVVGDQGGDVFVGQGTNLEFGFADKVVFDETNCTASVQTVLNVSPDTFATQYIYSEWGLRNNVIKYLDSLIVNPETPSLDSARYATSKNLWLKILADNQRVKDSTAIATRNISFDAGASYEYTMTSDTVTADETAEFVNSEGEVYTIIGFNALGVGATGTVKFIYSTSSGKTTGTETQSGIATGFVLKDNDIGDAFSVDVATDPKYKTPVFKTKIGQSSCPWEPKTAHREGNTLELQVGSSFDAIDVPSNEPAVYKFIFGNKSETYETFTYAFTAGPESNPHGAKIFLNGAALDHPVFYAIPYGTSIPVTLTIERGPVEYDYDSLEVVLYSLCEDTRANALGILPDLDTILYSAHYLSAHFIRPCSEVDINVPEQNWVIFPDPLTPFDDDVMTITVSGYDKSNIEFDKIRVQYRRSDGDGAWINIVPPNNPIVLMNQPGSDIVREDLGPTFTQFYWDTQGLGDGDYEIHAWAICSGDAAAQPGFSQIIKGRIEREPPHLIGLPQPSDGVFNQGDEISFTFNKDIDCSKINELDNVRLFNGGAQIDIDLTCKDNQIFLDPFFQSHFENKILRAQLDNIPDKTGNKLVYEDWEFYVDRNELAWLTDSLGMTKFDDQTKTVEAKIHNRGGSPVNFSLQNVPSWVRVVPNQGTLAANEILPVRFEVDSVLPFGHWTDTIVLHTETGQNPFFIGGDEGLPFGVRVVCRPPDWEFDPQAFTNSMNMVLQLDIDGHLSTDIEDMVVAWLGDTIVGRAHVEYLPQTDVYLVFLTVYGDVSQISSSLRLEIWDASACLRYEVLETNFMFQPDIVIGSPTAPQVIHTTHNVLRDVPIGKGWNWLSFNLVFPNPGLNAALASLNHPENDLMKSQTQFSTYASGSWVGTLAGLDNKKLYIYYADEPDTLLMRGNLISPDTLPIPVVTGWNWVGYVPQYSLPINDALGSLTPTAGDLIKSQTEFAQYINPTHGWLGNLKFMQPPQGYQIKLASTGTLTYPLLPPNRTSAIADAPFKGPGIGASFWTVDAAQFEHSTTLIGMLNVDDANATAATMELGAFVGGELRGAGQAVRIEPLQAYLFFLTAYANTTGEELTFKLFDAATGTVQDLNEKLAFSANEHRGSLDEPVPFTLKTSGVGEMPVLGQAFEVQPNPFHTETMFKFSLPRAQEVALTVVNTAGQLVSEARFAAHEGLNTRIWKPESADGSRLETGVYFVRLETATGAIVRKIVLH